ncbi:hypothetical protein B4122_3453 [Bacillus subtilis]|uniref:Uncharacterized protein n=1 Tax=Bacillus subtilis TaxID=1423 RepID=A0AAP1E2V1_BACIU|nr:hypothetical protein B4122_3453 [Bacillus subtilis]
MDSFTLSVVGLVDVPGTAFSERPFFDPEITLMFHTTFSKAILFLYSAGRRYVHRKKSILS